MLPFAYASHEDAFDFIQDIACIHAARICYEWLQALDITVLLCAAKSSYVIPWKMFGSFWRARFIETKSSTLQ